MTLAQHDPLYWNQRRDQWTARVAGLVDQIQEWAAAEGWTVEVQSKTITERPVGSYEVPALLVRLPGGELQVQPIGLGIAGGRVDVEAYPTLTRVMLFGRGDDWEIVTESNVPLRAPWTAETFVRLAHDLLA